MKKFRKKKQAAVILIIAMLVVWCSGCMQERKESAGSDKKNVSGDTEDKIQIGLSVDSFVIERWIKDRDVFVTAARELGAEVNVQDAGASVEEQISQIEYFISKKMDVIVVIARDCGALSEVMLEAKHAGIRTISYDRLVYDADTDLYISFDNQRVGTLMAEAMAEVIPQGGQVFMIQGSADDNNVRLVREGFLEEADKNGLEVVYEANCEGWIADHAVDFVEEGLKQYPQVSGIMCGNDDIASQVIQVLAENRLAGKVVVVGQDGDLAACQRIVEGTQYMTAFKSVEDEARQAALCAVQLGKDKKMQADNNTVSDGTYDVPAKILKPVAVTSANMDEVIIDGGFHRREDVYLNVR